MMMNYFEAFQMHWSDSKQNSNYTVSEFLVVVINSVGIQYLIDTTVEMVTVTSFVCFSKKKEI